MDLSNFESFRANYCEAGTYEFGAIDTSAYTGEIAYTSVSTSPGYWTFDAAGYSIGSAASSGAVSDSSY